MSGRGGNWNRAARRSGGNKPIEIVLPRGVECSACHTVTLFGLLKTVIVEGTPAKLCPTCDGVLFLQDAAGAWRTVIDLMAALKVSLSRSPAPRETQEEK